MNYQNRIRTGTYYGYDDNGNLKEIGEYTTGKKDGIWKYYSGSNLIKIEEFKSGNSIFIIKKIKDNGTDNFYKYNIVKDNITFNIYCDNFNPDDNARIILCKNLSNNEIEDMKNHIKKISIKLEENEEELTWE